MIGCLVAVIACQLTAAEGPPTIAARLLVDGPGSDACYHAAALDDGGLIAIGRLGPGGEPAEVLGTPQPEWTYGSAWIRRYDAEGTEQAVCSFASGLLLPTACAVSEAGVYLGGYAASGMIDLLAELPGLQRQADFQQRDLTTWCPPEHHAEPRRKPGTDQRGVPCVLLLDPDTLQLRAGTFLEGWQSTWHVPGHLREDVWQPLHLAVLSDGDVVVSHDGGYNRLPAEGETASFTEFYHVPDHLSRLSPDLTRRRWLRSWHSPLLAEPADVERYLHNGIHFTMLHGTPAVAWPHGHLGNPRVLRLAVDDQDRILLAGWSPTRTSGEPWWSPFLLRCSADGAITDRWYAPDPMSGPDDRMHGLVSDACVRSVAIGRDDTVLASVMGDGGNSVVRRDPRDYTIQVDDHWQGRLGPFSGRHLFWGGIVRLAEDGALLQGRYLGRTVERQDHRRRLRPLQQDCWAIALAEWTEDRVAVLGRFRHGLPEQEGAWSEAEEGSFLQIWTADFSRSLFVSPLPDGMRAYDLVRIGDRLAICGRQSSDAPTAAVILLVE